MLLSSVECGSLLCYLVRGCADTPERRKLHNAVYSVKEDKMMGKPSARPFSQIIAERFVELRADLPFGHFFTPDTILVPTPRSAPVKPDQMWPALRITQAMAQRGLGRARPILDRIQPVPKSSWAQKSGLPRPSSQKHFETMRLTASLPLGLSFLIVDDVVTHGATLLAAASHLKAAYPDSVVRCLAVARSVAALPIIDGVEAVRDPWYGLIRRTGKTTRLEQVKDRLPLA